MGKAFGYPEEFEFACLVTGLQLECCPAPKVRRFTAEIDGDVPDVAGENADEFTLRMTELVMKATEYSSSGERLVVLGEGRGKTERSKRIGIEDFGEPAAWVAIAPGLQDFYIAQGGIT